MVKEESCAAWVETFVSVRTGGNKHVFFLLLCFAWMMWDPPRILNHLPEYFAGHSSGDLREFLKCHVEALPVPQGVELRSVAAGLWQTRLKPHLMLMFRESWNQKSPPHHFVCAVPFTASWLPGIQIVQINGLEFLESLNWDSVLTSSEESCEIQPFPWKKTRNQVLLSVSLC